MGAEDYLKRLFVTGMIMAVWLVYVEVNKYYLHPYNWTDTMLRLPWTEWPFYESAYAMIHRLPALEYLLKKWYTVGFTSTFMGALIWFLATRRPKELDAGLLGFIVMHGTVMIIYAIAFVYPPHIVYGFNPIESPLMNLANHRFVFPSLHTALAVFLAMYFAWRERNRLVKGLFILNGFIVPTITILLVQHWIYDALAGILLAMFSFWVAKRYGKKFSEALDHWNLDRKALITATILLYVLTFGYSFMKVLGITRF